MQCRGLYVSQSNYHWPVGSRVAALQDVDLLSACSLSKLVAFDTNVYMSAKPQVAKVVAQCLRQWSLISPSILILVPVVSLLPAQACAPARCLPACVVAKMLMCCQSGARPPLKSIDNRPQQHAAGFAEQSLGQAASTAWDFFDT